MLRLKEEEEKEHQPTRYKVPPTPVESVKVSPVVTSPAPVRSQTSKTDEELQAYIRAATEQAAQYQQTSAHPVSTRTTPTLVEWYHHLVTNNPVFHKETLSQRRIQEKKQATTRTTERTLSGLAVFGLYVGFFYLLGQIYAIPNLADRSSAGWVLHTFLTVIQFLVMVLALPLQAATMITQEREKMTWNALLLSQLSPLQILVGKGAAALRPLLVTLALLLPALVLSAFVAQVTFKGILAAQVIMALTAVLNVTIALSCSLFAKKSQQASGNAGGAAMLPILGFPALTGIIQAGPWIAYTVMNGGNAAGYTAPMWFNYLTAFPNLFNPAVATFFGLTTPMVMNGAPAWFWLLAPTVYVVAATTTTWALWKKMLGQFLKAPKDFSG